MILTKDNLNKSMELNNKPSFDSDDYILEEEV